MFPPPAAHNRDDIAAIESTKPDPAKVAYDILMAVMGVGIASAPRSAAEAEYDRTHHRPVSPLQQATTIATMMIPVERILGLAWKAVSGSTLTTSAKATLSTLSKADWLRMLRRFLIDRRGSLRLPGTIPTPLEQGKLALLDIAAAESPIVVRDLSVASVNALKQEYGAGLAVALHERATIAPYDALAATVEGLGGSYQAHHIVEVQVLQRLGMPIDKCPAIVLTDVEHQAITSALAREIPPGHLESMTNREIREAYERVYTAHPQWIAEMRRYFH